MTRVMGALKFGSIENMNEAPNLSKLSRPILRN